MKPEVVYIGMDVCKEWLDVSIGLEGKYQRARYPNTAGGYRRLIRSLKSWSLVQVICEASGGYEASAVEALQDAGICVSVINPLRVRFYAKACGRMAKTDRLDADLLADYGRQRRPEPSRPLQAVDKKLQALMDRRAQLNQMLTAEKNRLHRCKDRWIKARLLRHIRTLRTELGQIDKALEQLVKAHEELDSKLQRLTQIKGVGKLTALGLLAEIPELGSINRRRVAALAGLAPFNRDSGNQQGLRRIYGGRAAARKTLYMAAVVASCRNPKFKAFYERLRNAGKPAKLALTAVMRKLLITLNAVLKSPQLQPT